MLPHLLTNFQIHKSYQNEPKFNGGGYSRNNLPNIKEWAYVINLDEYESIETRWIPLYVNGNNIYFDSFGLEHTPKDIKQFIENKKYNNKYL